jgi:hypothetical protein
MYVVWPLLLFAASAVWRRGRVSARWAVGVLLAGSVCSFLFCLRLTHTNEPWAFFSFPTRAWELGVGGLIAFAAPSLRTLPRGVAPLLGLSGLGAVLWSAFHFGAATPWPGDSAALPVLGAAAIIAAGCARRGQISAVVLAFPPLQFAGRISYSWYLWHWPVLILAPLVLNHPLDAAQSLSLSAGSGLLATASYFLVERPIHLSRWLAQRARRGVSLGVGLTASGVAVCVWSVVALALPTASANAVRPVVVPAAPFRVAHGDPDVALLASSTAAIQSALISSEDIEDVPTDLTPPLGGAFADEPVLYQDGCVDSFTSIAVGPCEYGDTASSTKVVLFGDSHAAMWFPAVEQAADRFGWNLYAWTKDTCPPVELPVISPDLGRSYDECTTWRDAVLEQIAEMRPALVVLGVSRHYSPIYGFTTYSPVWLNALAQMVTLIRQMGSQVLVLGPVPKPTFSVPSCLSENLQSATLCSTGRGSGVDLTGMREEESVVRNAGGNYVNTLFWFCTPSGICPPTVDDVLVYRDDNHITASYANLLGAPVSAALDLAVRGAPAPGSAVFLASDRR